jgi:hypothetical protein
MRHTQQIKPGILKHIMMVFAIVLLGKNAQYTTELEEAIRE